MEVRLVLDKGNSQRQAWQLHHPETVVGRRGDCNLRILCSEVSRRHCLLRIRDGCVNVADLNSINGTYVNGKRVIGEQVVWPGDHLEIGPLEFVVEYELSSSTLRRLKQPRHGGAAEQGDADVEENAVAVADEPPPLPLASDSQEAASASAIAVVEDDGSWRLPQTDDLRELLAQLDTPRVQPRRRDP